jgi:hypothetical protein
MFPITIYFKGISTLYQPFIESALPTTAPTLCPSVIPAPLGTAAPTQATTKGKTTPQILSTTTNNICCISCTVLPSGTGTSGYWYIDVTSYVGNQKGSIILCNISLNSASYLWTGRIVVQSYSTPAVKLYPDYVTGNLVIATSFHISGIYSFLQVSVSGGTYTILSTDNLFYKLIG